MLQSNTSPPCLHLIWINHTSPQSEGMFLFHLWSSEVTSPTCFLFKPPARPHMAAGHLFTATLQKIWLIFYRERSSSSDTGGGAVTFPYVWILIHSERVYSLQPCSRADKSISDGISVEIPLKQPQRIKPPDFMALSLIFMTHISWHYAQTYKDITRWCADTTERHLLKYL